jgi:hypothetical protein
MRIYNLPIEDFDIDEPVYEVIVENIKDEEMDGVFERLESSGFSLATYGYDNEVNVSMFRDEFWGTKAQFIKEVRRVAKGK